MRRVTVNDIGDVAQVFSSAKEALRSMKVDQWSGDYPNADTVRDDIKDGVGYAMFFSERAIGYLALKMGEEYGYDKIFEGQWVNRDQPYATVHRLALSKGFRGRGLSKLMLKEAADMAREADCVSLRTDTHPENTPMKALLQSMGFAYCGKYHLPDGEEEGALRLCYEMQL